MNGSSCSRNGCSWRGRFFARRSGGKNLAKSLAGILVISFRIKAGNQWAQKQLFVSPLTGRPGTPLTVGSDPVKECRSVMAFDFTNKLANLTCCFL